MRRSTPYLELKANDNNPHDTDRCRKTRKDPNTSAVVIIAMEKHSPISTNIGLC